MMRIILFGLVSIVISSCTTGPTPLPVINKTMADKCREDMFENVSKLIIPDFEYKLSEYYRRSMVRIRGKLKNTNIQVLVTKSGKLAPRIICPKEGIGEGPFEISKCDQEISDKKIKSVNRQIRCDDLSLLAQTIYKSLECSVQARDYAFVIDQTKILQDKDFLGGCLPDDVRNHQVLKYKERSPGKYILIL
ncbi:hypothetical protein ACRXCV_10270 [Halobacteriovorax sp. GFR7]|uniref:hypothetical protein n=1 Tax=unclassified Halobacteriovorax TaxID=2639665 RepID=UPI003D95CD39